jgi:tyrosine-protein kinase Etk/Wzc
MGVLEQLLALMRWKRMILLNTLLVAAVSIAVALLLPKWYRSTVSIFPPEDDTWSASNLSSLVSAASIGMSKRSIPLFGSPSDVYAAVLKSRTLREEIINRFDLMNDLKAKNMDEALQAFRGRMKVKTSGEGIISVRIEDRSPRRAADIANACVEILDRINREKRNVTGRQARVFLEARLALNRSEMAAAEDTLRRIQERTGVLIPDEQLKSVITAAADLNNQLILEEVDLAVLRSAVGPEHPERQALEREVASLRNKLAELDQGTPGRAEGVRQASIEGSPRPPSPPAALEVPLKEYPRSSMECVRAMREVKVQEAIYEFLCQQYETYRLQEKRDTPTVQVLDAAVPAERKSWPIRWLICSSASLLALGLSILLALGFESIARMKRITPERYARVRELAREVRLASLLDRL